MLGVVGYSTQLPLLWARERTVASNLHETATCLAYVIDPGFQKARVRELMCLSSRHLLTSRTRALVFERFDGIVGLSRCRLARQAHGSITDGADQWPAKGSDEYRLPTVVEHREGEAWE